MSIYYFALDAEAWLRANAPLVMVFAVVALAGACVLAINTWSCDEDWRER